MVNIKALTKSFGKYTVFENLNLHIGPNEAVGLIGMSGVGKSTLLKIIAGIVRPDSGTVELGSTRLGFIFQEPRLIPWKSVIDNVIIGASALGLDIKSAKEKARAILHKVGLLEQEKCFPAHLSGGMSQRVSIARAFFIDPDILLMDEPFSSLDPMLKSMMHNYIRDLLLESSITLLYVSHLPGDLFKIVSKIYLLNGKAELKLVTNMKQEQHHDAEQFNDYVNSLYSR